MGNPNSIGRIQSIDAVRGLCVIMMVIHHFLFDLVEFLDAPAWLFSNSVFDGLHYVFAGLFILLSGVSSRFSRSNVRRGLKVIAAALVITLITVLIEMPIYFGILHFLGFSMVFYGIVGTRLEKIPNKAAPMLYGALFILTQLLISRCGLQSKYLWVFGITYPGFFSADYFPIFPWLFLFLTGTWLGMYIKNRKLPERFYTLRPPVLPAVGRKAFLIYLLHQPVLYALTYLMGKLLDR
jgi:uncharacterized membrane protein